MQADEDLLMFLFVSKHRPKMVFVIRGGCANTAACLNRGGCRAVHFPTTNTDHT